MKKGILILSAIFVSLAAGIALADTATYDYIENGLGYNIIPDSVNCVEVTLCIEKFRTDSVVIPASVTIDNTDYKVVALGDKAFYSRRKIPYLELPSTLNSIGGLGLYNLVSCKYVKIPQNVKEIGWAALCQSPFKSIVIPDNIEAISASLLNRCDSLHVLVLGKGIKTIGGSALAEIRDLSEIYIMAPEPPELKEYPFSGCHSKDAIVYVPFESISKYDKRPEDKLDYDNWNKYEDGEFDDTWAFFYDYRPIPDLFVVNYQEDIDIEEQEAVKLAYDIVNYAEVEVLGERWEYDPEVIAIEGDVLTGKAKGTTTVKKVVETSTGDYESHEINVKVRGIGESGVTLPVADEDPFNSNKNGASTSSDNLAAKCLYYSIDGRPAGNDASRLAPGVYIELRAGKACKFVKR